MICTQTERGLESKFHRAQPTELAMYPYRRHMGNSHFAGPSEMAPIVDLRKCLTNQKYISRQQYISRKTGPLAYCRLTVNLESVMEA